MKEKCIEKLKEWLGNSDFDYEIVKITETECIFVVVFESNSYDDRTIALYRVFKLGNSLGISEDFKDYLLDNADSITHTVSSIIRAYARVSE